jgi:ubiquitin-conjugating enzyme E2 variant
MAENSLSFIAVVLFADFFSGVLHWAIDSYARTDLPLVGKWIGQPNIEHHKWPRAFLLRSWLQSSWDLLLLASTLLVGLHLAAMLTWHACVFALLVCNANEIHKWAHRSRNENGRLITVLQLLKLVQSRRHHARHHTEGNKSHYCVLTDFVNPVVDALRFWRAAEVLVEAVIGLARREEK